MIWSSVDGAGGAGAGTGAGGTGAAIGVAVGVSTVGDPGFAGSDGWMGEPAGFVGAGGRAEVSAVAGGTTSMAASASALVLA
jgi:hypothetical protein